MQLLSYIVKKKVAVRAARREEREKSAVEYKEEKKKKGEKESYQGEIRSAVLTGKERGKRPDRQSPRAREGKGSRNRPWQRREVQTAGTGKICGNMSFMREKRNAFRREPAEEKEKTETKKGVTELEEGVFRSRSVSAVPCKRKKISPLYLAKRKGRTKSSRPVRPGGKKKGGRGILSESFSSMLPGEGDNGANILVSRGGWGKRIGNRKVAP